MSALLYSQQQFHIVNVCKVERQAIRLSCSQSGVYLGFHCGASQMFSMKCNSTCILPKLFSIGRTFPVSMKHNNSPTTASLGT